MIRIHRTLWTLLGVLALQALLFVAITRRETPTVTHPLTGMPTQLGAWRMVQEGVEDPSVMAVLRASQTMNRTYTSSVGGAFLFVAYFDTQRAGQTPHSPKHCLPGAGWVQDEADIVRIPVPSMGTAVEANRYIVSKGDSHMLVLYWYQSHGRTVASEYKAKVYVVADAIRLNRTDTSLVRVMVPIFEGGSDAAYASATRFIQDMFPQLQRILPT